MRLKFKTLAYETNAIEFVVDCFDGQPISSIWPKADASSVIKCPVIAVGYTFWSSSTILLITDNILW